MEARKYSFLLERVIHAKIVLLYCNEAFVKRLFCGEPEELAVRKAPWEENLSKGDYAVRKDRELVMYSAERRKRVYEREAPIEAKDRNAPSVPAIKV